MVSMEQVDRLEIPEYELLIKAQELRQVDEEYTAHEIAFLGVAARATKGKRGTPVYKKFKDFFDYEKAVRKVLDGQKRVNVMQEVSALLKTTKETRKRKKEGIDNG